MAAIVHPLKPGMKGSAVTDLQDALLILLEAGRLSEDDKILRDHLATGLRQERAKATYGNVTAEAVVLCVAKT